MNENQNSTRRIGDGSSTNAQWLVRESPEGIRGFAAIALTFTGRNTSAVLHHTARFIPDTMARGKL